MTECGTTVIKASRQIDETASLTSIIIPVAHGFAYTQLCIESVRRHSCDAYEIILVDNGSTDGTDEWVKSNKDIVYRRNDINAGFPAAINQGLLASSGSEILL